MLRLLLKLGSRLRECHGARSPCKPQFLRSSHAQMHELLETVAYSEANHSKPSASGGRKQNTESHPRNFQLQLAAWWVSSSAWRASGGEASGSCGSTPHDLSKKVKVSDKLFGLLSVYQSSVKLPAVTGVCAAKLLRKSHHDQPQ